MNPFKTAKAHEQDVPGSAAVDGMPIGYVESDALEAAQAGMAATDVNARWQAEMAGFSLDLGDARPDTGFALLEEVFHLEDQLDPPNHLGEETP